MQEGDQQHEEEGVPGHLHVAEVQKPTLTITSTISGGSIITVTTPIIVSSSISIIAVISSSIMVVIITGGPPAFRRP